MLSECEREAWIKGESWKIYRVVSPPTPERVHWLKEGRSVLPGDFGWGAPLVSPPERVGQFITLEGWDDDYRWVWLASLLPAEVEFAAPKLDLTQVGPYPNPYAVQKPKS